MPVIEEVCGVCGDKLVIHTTEDGKVFEGQFKRTRSGDKAHVECVRVRGRERMMENPNLV